MAAPSRLAITTMSAMVAGSVRNRRRDFAIQMRVPRSAAWISPMAPSARSSAGVSAQNDEMMKKPIVTRSNARSP